MKIEDTEMLGR